MNLIVRGGTVSIPPIGLGTWLSKDDSCKSAILHALKLGYRLIDTAAMYNNGGMILLHL